MKLIVLGAVVAIVAFLWVDHVQKMKVDDGDRFVIGQARAKLQMMLVIHAEVLDKIGYLNESNIEEFKRIVTSDKQWEPIPGDYVRINGESITFEGDRLGYEVDWVDEKGNTRVSTVKHLGGGKFDERTRP